MENKYFIFIFLFYFLTICSCIRYEPDDFVEVTITKIEIYPQSNFWGKKLNFVVYFDNDSMTIVNNTNNSSERDDDLIVDSLQIGRKYWLNIKTDDYWDINSREILKLKNKTH